jgi:hypothetical protein
MLSEGTLVANGESIIEIPGITSKEKGALVISLHRAFGIP